MRMNKCVGFSVIALLSSTALSMFSINQVTEDERAPAAADDVALSNRNALSPYGGGGVYDRVPPRVFADTDYRALEVFLLHPFSYEADHVHVRVMIVNMGSATIELPNHRRGGGFAPLVWHMWSRDAALRMAMVGSLYHITFSVFDEKEPAIAIPPYGREIIDLKVRAPEHAVGFNLAVTMFQTLFEFRYDGPVKDAELAWEDVPANAIYRARFTPDGALHVPLDEKSSE